MELDGTLVECNLCASGCSNNAQCGTEEECGGMLVLVIVLFSVFCGIFVIVGCCVVVSMRAEKQRKDDYERFKE